MNLKKNYISSASAQSLGRVCTMGANFIVFVMAARMLGTELFGQYSYITVFLGLAIMVAEFGTTSVLAADLGRAGDETALYWGNFLILRTLFTLMVMVVAVPVAWIVRPDLFSCLLAGLVGLFFLGSRFFDPLFQIHERPWLSFTGSVVYALAFAILSISALLLKRPLFDLIIAYVLANIVYTLFAARQSLSIIRPTFRFRWSMQKSMLALALPVGISGIFTLIHTRADTFMLAMMKGDYEVGIYNGAYRFLDMAVIAAVMLSTPLVPILATMAIDSTARLRERYSQIVVLLAGTLVPLALLVPLISDICVKLLFGHEYREVAPLLDIMAWIGVLTFFSMFNFVALLAVKVVRFQIWLSILTALLNVALNFLLIPRFSFYGSAWATLMVESIFVAVSFVYVVKSIGNIFSYAIWWRLAATNLLLLIVVTLTGNQGVEWRLPLAVGVWIGAQVVFKIPLWKMLPR